jgi:hypothetical protein
VTGKLREIYNEELNNFYFPPTIVLVIKSRRTRRAGYIAWIGVERLVQGVVWKT